MKDDLIIHVVPNKVQREISALYSVPGTHVLFTGPRECARHNCRMHYRLGRISWLCPTDTDLALGKMESMVISSVKELVERYNGNLFGVILYSGCQTEFLNVDFEYLMKKIRERFHISAAHHSISRFQRFDHLRPAENDIFEDLFHLLENEGERRSGEKPSSLPGGLQVLSRPVPMADDNDFRFIAEKAGLGWARNTGEWSTEEDFLKCRESVLNIVTSEERMPAARYLESVFGIPWILLTDSCRMSVVKENHKLLSEKMMQISGIQDISGETARLRQMARREIEEVLHLAGERKLTLDLTGTGRPWDLTRALIEYGFRIEKIIMSRFPMMPGMKPPPGMRAPRGNSEDMEWVLAHVPDLAVEEKMPDRRVFLRGGERIHDLPEYLENAKAGEVLTPPDRSGAGNRMADQKPSEKRIPFPDGDPSSAALWGTSSVRSLMNVIRGALLDPLS